MYHYFSWCWCILLYKDFLGLLFCVFLRLCGTVLDLYTYLLAVLYSSAKCSDDADEKESVVKTTNDDGLVRSLRSWLLLAKSRFCSRSGVTRIVPYEGAEQRR